MSKDKKGKDWLSKFLDDDDEEIQSKENISNIKIISPDEMAVVRDQKGEVKGYTKVSPKAPAITKDDEESFEEPHRFVEHDESIDDSHLVAPANQNAEPKSRISNKQIMDMLERIKSILDNMTINTASVPNKLKPPYDEYSSTLIRMEIINRGLPQDGRMKADFVEVLNLNDIIVARGLENTLRSMNHQGRRAMKSLIDAN